VSTVERYIADASEHGRCTETGDYKTGNAAIERLMKDLAELRAHADRGEAVLLKLISHPNHWVKSAAAWHLLPLRAELACAVLENLATGPPSELEFNAKMLLQEWRAGRLKVP
jgi:hypothetical protein